MKFTITSTRLFSTLAICLSTISFSACSIPTPAEEKPSIDALVIKNLTRTDVSDVKIQVEKLKGVFTCNIILTDSFCSNGFRERNYENNKITISWAGKNQRHTIGPIAIDMSQALIKINKNDNKPYTAVIELQNEGAFDAYFELPNSK